jgi:hypothetical protein
MGVKIGFSHYGKNLEQGYEREILRRIYGLKRGELTGSWRKLYYEELVICALHQHCYMIK